MKNLNMLLVVLVMACGGKLTKEERAKLHEGMASQEIRRVTDAELQEAALKYGSDVMRDIEKTDKYLLKTRELDSLASARGVKISSLTPDNATMKKIEQDLIDAYITGAAAGTAVDNLQALGEDSLLFTRPVFKMHPDGSQEFSHAIGIRMAKRTVVLSMPQP